MECCPKWVSWVVLLVGLVMVGQDLAMWNFWTLQPWAVVFLLAGLSWVVPRN